MLCCGFIYVQRVSVYVPYASIVLSRLLASLTSRPLYYSPIAHHLMPSASHPSILIPSPHTVSLHILSPAILSPHACQALSPHVLPAHTLHLTPYLLTPSHLTSSHLAVLLSCALHLCRGRQGGGQAVGLTDYQPDYRERGLA